MRSTSTFGSTTSQIPTLPKTTVPSQPIVQKSPWHSPMPYLFGGLAAMLGLIAFALLILACSYWKVYREIEETHERDVEAAAAAARDGKLDGTAIAKSPPVFEEIIGVIMAGDQQPSFLATPIPSKTSSTKKCENGGRMMDGVIENSKEEARRFDQTSTSESPREP